MTIASSPEGWDFDPAFLDSAQFLPQPVAHSDSPQFGTARRAQARDLAPLLHAAEAPPRHALDPIVPWFHPLVTELTRGRSLARHHVLKGQSLLLRESLVDRHLLAVGPPGAGKTSQWIVPVLAALLGQKDRSVVLFDPKGDLFPLVRALAARAGRPPRSILRLNLTEPATSIGWSPLRRDCTRHGALGIASRLVLASEQRGSADSPFWRNISIELIADIALALCRDAAEVPTLPRVLEVLNLPRGVLLKWLQEHGILKFAAFLESGSHNAETCLADAGMRMLSLIDEQLCAVLSHDELDLDRLTARPTVLVVEMDETRIEQLRPIFALLVQQILDRAIAAAGRQPDARLRFPLSVVIDEFASAIGQIPRLPTRINTLRSRRISVVAAVQGLGQIRSVYGGDADALLTGFSSKLFFPNLEVDDAEYASRQCGTMTVELPAPGGGGGPGMLAPRRLYLPDEIARPPQHPVLGFPVLLLLADHIPFQAYLAPTFRRPDLAPLLPRAGSRGRRGPRRRQPLTYVPVPLDGPTPPTTKGKDDATFLPSGSFRSRNVTGWTQAMFRERIQALQKRLGLDRLDPMSRLHWTSWCAQWEQRPRVLLAVCDNIVERRGDLPAFVRALRESTCDDPHAALAWMEFDLRRRAIHDARHKLAPKDARNDAGNEAADADPA